jgi:hypothetical protein
MTGDERVRGQAIFESFPADFFLATAIARIEDEHRHRDLIGDAGAADSFDGLVMGKFCAGKTLFNQGAF